MMLCTDLAMTSRAKAVRTSSSRETCVFTLSTYNDASAPYTEQFAVKL